jgi:hypothetical protein
MNFNPFEKLSVPLIDAFRSKEKRWLVSQTLDVSPDEALGPDRVFLLVSHYENQGMASVHLKAVSSDRFAALIDLEREKHRATLLSMLRPDSRYVVYSSLIRNRARAEQMASQLYKEKYWKYVLQYSKSGISPSKNLRPSIQLIFGEIFIVLKYGSETLRTRLSDIEKM